MDDLKSKKPLLTTYQVWSNQSSLERKIRAFQRLLQTDNESYRLPDHLNMLRRNYFLWKSFGID
jgi:hypothetical protein